MDGESVERLSCTRIQCVWRGYYTRKKLVETRQEYMEIFNEIEECDVNIHWPDRFGLPAFDDEVLGDRVNRVICTFNQPNVDGEISAPKLAVQEEKFTNSTSSISFMESQTEVNCSSNEHITEVEHKDSCCQTEQSKQEEHFDGLILTDAACSTPQQTPRERRTIDVDFKKTDRFSQTDRLKRNSTDEDVKHLEVAVTNVETRRSNLLTDSWLSDKTFNGSESLLCTIDHPGTDDQLLLTAGKNKGELEKLKEDLTLELLWISQAITSRKTYLRMKEQL